MFCKLLLVVFRYGNLPRDFPTPWLPLASWFSGYVSMDTKQNGWKERGVGWGEILAIGGICQLRKWDFLRLGNFFQDFFPRREGGGTCPDVEVDEHWWVALAAWCIQSTSMGLEILMLFFMATCCYRDGNLIKKSCFLLSEAGYGDAPSWLSLLCHLKGWSEPADTTSPCLHRHIAMLVYFIYSSAIKLHLKASAKSLMSLAGHLAMSIWTVIATPSCHAGLAQPLTSNEDIKPKVYCSQLKANPKLWSLQGKVTALLRRSRIYEDGAARSLSCILIADVTHQVSG